MATHTYILLCVCGAKLLLHIKAIAKTSTYARQMLQAS